MRTVHILTGCGLAAGVFLATMALLSGPYAFIGIDASDTATAVKPTARVARPAPLLGADGTPQPALPQAVPADPRARTQVALYATRDQARALEAELDGDRRPRLSVLQDKGRHVCSCCSRSSR